MQTRRVVSPRKFLVALALVSIVVGVTLVIADERANERRDLEFSEAQFALRSSFGVFDTRTSPQISRIGCQVKYALVGSGP